jgi:hypothetical protein
VSGPGGASLSDEDKPGGEVVRVDFGAKRPVPSSKPATISSAPGRHDEEKLAVFTRMIDRGLVMVTLDGRAPGVMVPEHLADEPQLALNFSHRFGIDDFAYDERGVRASLSFSGRDVFCDVPWTAVWMMRSQVDGELAISPESVPPEIQAALAQASEELEEARARDEAASAASRQGELGLPATPPAAASSVEREADDEGPDDPKPPGGGLRLVKG